MEANMELYNGSLFSQIVLAVTVIIISLLTIVIGYLRSQSKKRASYLDYTHKILTNLTPEQGIEKHLNQYIEILMPIIQADGYYFYLFDHKSAHYVLRVNRVAGSKCGQIEPSYSGLVPYQKEKYNPPLGLPGTFLGDGDIVSIVKDGEVPLVQIVITGGDGLIQIGPVRHVSKKDLLTLKVIGETIKPALAMLQAFEKQKHDAELLMVTSKAISGLANTNFDVKSMRSQMMTFGAKMIEATGYCLIVHQNDKFEVPIIYGLDDETEKRFQSDTVTLKRFIQYVEVKDCCQYTQNAKEVYQIPLYQADAGPKSTLLLKVSGRTFKGVAVFWHLQEVEIEQHRIETLKMLLNRLGNIYDQQSKYEELANSYIRALRALVEATDNVAPHTVGHSNLVANYSVAIAKELNFPLQDLQEIKLAGYFHDVGMLGLTSDILFKAGSYTPLEYDTMKLHAEVGAAIGESAIGNSNISSYIRHHHERWDGFGYPQGLKGEKIPLGARIIAVADMFNAKLVGRKYREPVTFERAAADLRAASGTQLDPAAVEALLNWFKKKQTNPRRQGKTLGPCWEMRCCPPSIYNHCAVFNSKAEKKCWEYEEVNCILHGNNCATCFVRTETIYRAEQKLSFLSTTAV